MKWQDRISVDPLVCRGRPCIKGTRVMVRVILASLAEGSSPQSIADAYHVAEDDIRAALLFAADMGDDPFVPLERGAG